MPNNSPPPREQKIPCFHEGGGELLGAAQKIFFLGKIPKHFFFSKFFSEKMRIPFLFLQECPHCEDCREIKKKCLYNSGDFP